jgi:hypothetical protein
MNVGAASEVVDFFQPTIQPTKAYFLYGIIATHREVLPGTA